MAQNNLLEEYRHKLEENTNEWKRLFTEVEEDFDPWTLARESIASVKNGQAVTYFKDPEANRKARKAAKGHVESERLRQRLLDTGIDEETVDGVYDECMIRLNQE